MPRKRFARAGARRRAVRPARPGRATVDQVAQAIQGTVRKFAAVLHQQVYANRRGHAPAAVLDALGARKDGVLAILAAAERVALAAMQGAPPPVQPAEAAVAEAPAETPAAPPADTAGAAAL